jgi:hypothetical protein
MNKLEEAVKKLFNDFQKENPIVPDDDIRPFELGFIYGIKWQTERMYSDEEVLELLPKFAAYTLINADEENRLSLKEWFEQFKKK